MLTIVPITNGFRADRKCHIAAIWLSKGCQPGLAAGWRLRRTVFRGALPLALPALSPVLVARRADLPLTWLMEAYHNPVPGPGYVNSGPPRAQGHHEFWQTCEAAAPFFKARLPRSTLLTCAIVLEHAREELDVCVSDVVFEGKREG
jgi:hypothetical protein